MKLTALDTTILCSVLRYLGFNKSILTDIYSEKVVKAKALDNPVVIQNDQNKINKKNISFIVSIERTGRNKQNNYCTMRNKNINHCTAPLNLIFNDINEIKVKYLTIGVGDKVNEVRTVNVKVIVISDVNFGDEIYVITLSDYLIMVGVSNWRGIAIAAVICIINNDKNVAQFFFDLCDEQKSILENMIKNGSYDVIKQKFI